MFFTSLDGTIACMHFKTGDLGYPRTTEENFKALSKYGAGRRVGMVEGADALRLEEGSKAGEL